MVVTMLEGEMEWKKLQNLAYANKRSKEAEEMKREEDLRRNNITYLVFGGKV